MRRDQRSRRARRAVVADPAGATWSAYQHVHPREVRVRSSQTALRLPDRAVAEYLVMPHHSALARVRTPTPAGELDGYRDGCVRTAPFTLAVTR